MFSNEIKANDAVKRREEMMKEKLTCHLPLGSDYLVIERENQLSAHASGIETGNIRLPRVSFVFLLRLSTLDD